MYLNYYTIKDLLLLRSDVHLVQSIRGKIMQKSITLLQIGGDVHHMHTNKSGSRTYAKNPSEALYSRSKGQS